MKAKYLLPSRCMLLLLLLMTACNSQSRDEANAGISPVLTGAEEAAMEETEETVTVVAPAPKQTTPAQITGQAVGNAEHPQAIVTVAVVERDDDQREDQG